MTALTVSLLFAADFFFEVFPDRYAPMLEARKKFCESIAIQFSSLLDADDQAALRQLMEDLVERNPDVISLGLHKVDDSLYIQTTEHERGWKGAQANTSTSTHVRVPLFNRQQEYGEVEVHFTPLRGEWHNSVLSSPMFHLIVVILTFGFLAYTLFIKRMLRYLDPSSVVPGRVKAALDQLVEGVVLLDEHGHIVLVNDAFAELVAKPIQRLVGMTLSSFDWRQEGQGQLVLPWEGNQQYTQIKAFRLILNTKKHGSRILSTNVSMIMDDKGKQRGILVSFDDISDLEQKNVELKETIQQLESAEKKILSQNEELRRLATIDPLTGVFNRRAFFEKFNTEFNLAQNEGLELCCLMADIDHFKSINDNYGHSIGDDVIKGIASILRENCVTNGAVGRYGGEEFCVVLPGTDINQAVMVAEKMRTDFSKWSEFSSSPTHGNTITASFGISSITFGAEDLDQLLDEADQALYESKTQGRNRVSAWNKHKQSLAGMS